MTMSYKEFLFYSNKRGWILSIYLTRMFGVLNKMKTYGGELSDQRVVQKVLISLPRGYDSIIFF